MVPQLRIKKKITAILPDGTSKMNLGIPSVTAMLAGIESVVVTIDPEEAAAKPLLDELAATMGYEVAATTEMNTYVMQAAPLAGKPLATEALSAPELHPHQVAASQAVAEQGTVTYHKSEGASREATREDQANLPPVTSSPEEGLSGREVQRLKDVDLAKAELQMGANIHQAVQAMRDQGLTIDMDKAREAAAELQAGAEDLSDLQPTAPIMTVQADDDLEKLYPPNSPLQRNGTIVLGAQEVFTDCEKAYAHLVGQLAAEGAVVLPNRYHAELTQTFFKGSVEGQIHSVFKDLKRFGKQPKVLQKIVNLLQYAREASDPTYRTYIYFLRKNFLPHHTITFANGRVRSPYFKLWFMYALLQREAKYNVPLEG